MSNLTTLTPRTYALRKALERYAELHPSQANHIQLQEDMGGFITDMLADLYLLCDEEGFALPHLAHMLEEARRRATKERKPS